MLGGLRCKSWTEVTSDPRVTVNEGSFVLGLSFMLFDKSFWALP